MVRKHTYLLYKQIYFIIYENNVCVRVGCPLFFDENQICEYKFGIAKYESTCRGCFTTKIKKDEMTHMGGEYYCHVIICNV